MQDPSPQSEKTPFIVTPLITRLLEQRIQGAHAQDRRPLNNIEWELELPHGYEILRGVVTG
jgi:hypothetical protein